MIPESCCMVLLSVWLMSFPVQVTITTTGKLPTPGESVSCKPNRQYVAIINFNQDVFTST